jgi:D-serine deaminase-like pyridoxal phosphate-dependent protein
VPWDDSAGLGGVVKAVRSGRHEFAGVLTHNGATYRESTAEGVRRSHALAMKRMGSAREAVEAVAPGPCAVSVGDTPAVSLVDDLGGADEVRPGNFVFCDLTQVALGACSLDDVAVVVACPVVSVYKRRDQALLYGGAVHLSLDSMEDQGGRRIFGRASPGWPESASVEGAVLSLSQEHGIVETGGMEPAPGDLVCVMPVHSCLTCDLYPEYATLDGERLETLRAWRGA